MAFRRIKSLHTPPRPPMQGEHTAARLMLEVLVVIGAFVLLALSLALAASLLPV